MARLTPGRPFTQAASELLVENELAAGRYRFQLVVIDDSGLESAPAELVVTVSPPIVRGPILRPPVITRVNPQILSQRNIRPQ